MKSGLTIDELSSEVLRQNLAKQDYLVKTGNLQMETFGGGPLLRLIDDHDVDLVEPLDIKPTAHKQFSSYLDIPSKYYNRMLSEHPSLLAHNVNSWLGRKAEQKMVRTLDGAARALVSNRYRRIDHLDILQAILPIIGKLPDARFESRFSLYQGAKNTFSVPVLPNCEPSAAVMVRSEGKVRLAYEKALRPFHRLRAFSELR